MNAIRRRRALSAVSIVAVCIGVSALPAHAKVSNSSGNNIQSGRNRASSDQDGDANVGSSIGGQQVDVSAGGDASVNATNSGDHVRADTGDASSNNGLAGFVGLSSADGTDIKANISDSTATNIQEGDNRFEYDQTADSNSGDGIGGQLVSIFAKGSAAASLVNDATHVDVDTGSADSSNDAAAFVGLAAATDTVSITATISFATATNIQDGNNKLDGRQHADSDTGSASVGQAVDVTAGVDAALSATNNPDHVSASSGSADSDNDASSFVGLVTADGADITADLLHINGPNVQAGDNLYRMNQLADASSGDAVTGQHAQATAGGRVEVSLEGKGTHTSASTGDADTNQDEELFVGLPVLSGILLVGP